MRRERPTPDPRRARRAHRAPAPRGSAARSFAAAEPPALPAVLEQADASAGARMPGARLVIQAQAEAGPFRHGETPIGLVHAWWMVDEVLHPRVGEVVEVLEHLVVRRRHGEMKV